MSLERPLGAPMVVDGRDYGLVVAGARATWAQARRLLGSKHAGSATFPRTLPWVRALERRTHTRMALALAIAACGMVGSCALPAASLAAENVNFIGTWLAEPGQNWTIASENLATGECTGSSAAIQFTMSGCKVTGDEYEFVLEEPGYKSFNAGTIEGNKVHGGFHDTNKTEESYAATRTPNLTGTWSAVYHCEVGCPGEEFSAADTLSQTEGSNTVTGSNEGESISGTLTGNTLEFHSSTPNYEAKATLTVSADGRSWSGTLQDSHGTSGTYTATKQAVESKLGGIDVDSYCAGLGYPGKPGGEPSTLRKEVEGPEFAFNNWACVRGEGALVPIATGGPPLSMNNACVFEFPAAGPSHAKPENPNNAFSWNCFEGAPAPEEPPASTGPSSPTATVTPAPQLAGVPAPQLAVTGNVAPVSGTVLVELPGTTTFVPLSSLRQIPFGTLINAIHGRVSVTTAGPHGGTQTGEFFEGEFVLSQGHNGLVVATLAGGSFAGCPTARERAHRARAASSGKHVVRKLWADAHGSFSTKGNYAAGAVAGTEWLTEDLCDGTLIRVTRDKVAVTNLVTHRHVLVRVGHSYLAKAP